MNHGASFHIAEHNYRGSLQMQRNGGFGDRAPREKAVRSDDGGFKQDVIQTSSAGTDVGARNDSRIPIADTGVRRHSVSGSFRGGLKPIKPRRRWVLFQFKNFNHPTRGNLLTR